MISPYARGGMLAALSAVVIMSSALPVLAGSNTIRIGSNHGGRIGDFMSRLTTYRQAGVEVQFAGSCDSACTLLLALPRSQTCITTGAVFRFHAPTAGSARTSLAAKHYMMSKYPGWVRSWIASRRGLTGQLISMDYSYASRFMRTCDQIASR